MKNYYELLSIEHNAPPDEIKAAFRREIARYHPDKVQHLGREFQDLAASRAAELTEAYGILMDPRRRDAYDSQRREHKIANPEAASAARPPSAAAVKEPPPASAPPHSEGPSQPVGPDEFLKKAAVIRFRKAVETELGAFEEMSARGFDVGYETRAKALLGRDWKSAFKKVGPPIELLGRVVGRVDAASVDEIWPLVSRLARPEPDVTVCVFLMGAGLAPTRELADAISQQRRRQRKGPVPVVVPIDVRNWQALIPADAPATVKAIVERLKES